MTKTLCPRYASCSGYGMWIQTYVDQHLFRRVRPTSSGANGPNEDRLDDNAITRSDTSLSATGKEKK